MSSEINFKTKTEEDLDAELDAAVKLMIQIFTHDQDKTEEECPECSGVTKQEGCVYILCQKHYEEWKKGTLNEKG